MSKISGIGTVPVGKIETGVLNVGKNIVFNPSMKGGEVKSIEMHHTMVDKAEPRNVGFNVRGLAADDIRRGDAVYPDNEPTSSTRFVACRTNPAYGHSKGCFRWLHSCVPRSHRSSAVAELLEDQ